ncbi:MAG: hypothetical protein ABL997_09165, partial [Planctomycetota bacterium]
TETSCGEGGTMRRLVRVIRLVVIAVVAVLSLPAQSTWVVDLLQRPGFQFSDLPAAVAASAPGDRIFLRAVSTNPWEGYTAATIQGKGLVIQGEVGTGLPPVIVVGPWSLSGLPAGQQILMRSLTLRGDPFTPRGFSWSAMGCPGAILFEDVTFTLDWVQFSVSWPPFNAEWLDCDLVSLRGCTIDRGDLRWRLHRSKMTMTNCTMVQSPAFTMGFGMGITETLLLDSSRLTLTASTIRGGDAYSTGPFGQVMGGSEAIHLRNSSTIIMGASSVLMGGTDTIGGRNRWTYDETLTTSPSTLWRDASCQLIGRALVQCCPLEYVQPQTGIVPTESPGQIQIEQTTEPSAPTILLLAPLQTTPWSFVIGPVYLDPTNLWSDLSIAPASGVLTRTLTIPPSIPIGQWVGAQAFSLDSTGRIMASNVTTVGVW